MKILFCSKMVKCKVRVVRNGKCVTITNPTYHHCGPFILTPSKIFQILLIIQNTFLPWRYLCYFGTIELVVFIFVSAEIIGHLWAIIGLHEIINVALICSYHKPPPVQHWPQEVLQTAGTLNIFVLLFTLFTQSGQFSRQTRGESLEERWEEGLESVYISNIKNNSLQSDTSPSPSLW